MPVPGSKSIRNRVCYNGLSYLARFPARLPGNPAFLTRGLDLEETLYLSDLHTFLKLVYLSIPRQVLLDHMEISL